MRHERFDRGLASLRRAERWVIRLLRLWQADLQDESLDELTGILGAKRAAFCLSALKDLTELLRRHGWHSPLVLPVGARGYSDDELAIASLVMTATEQDREQALAEAAMMVAPTVLIPLVSAAERMGLPLLCTECRERLRRAAARSVPFPS